MTGVNFTGQGIWYDFSKYDYDIVDPVIAADIVSTVSTSTGHVQHEQDRSDYTAKSLS
jgi:hypothetical protein